MLIEPIVIGLFLGFVFKGKLAHFLDLNLFGVYLPIFSFSLEFLAGVLNKADLLNGTHVMILQLFIYIPLLWFLWLNRHLLGMRIIGFGVLLNFIVIMVNMGFMPVSAEMGLKYGFVQTLEALKQGFIFGHKLLTNADYLTFLGDWIMIPPPYWFPKTISPGDMLMDIGLMVTVISGMRGGHKGVY